MPSLPPDLFEKFRMISPFTGLIILPNSIFILLFDCFIEGMISKVPEFSDCSILFEFSGCDLVSAVILVVGIKSC